MSINKGMSYSSSTDNRVNTFRVFNKGQQFEFPKTYKEFRKIRSTMGPITVSEMYEKMADRPGVTRGKEAYTGVKGHTPYAPVNPSGFRSMTGGKSFGKKYKRFAKAKKEANTWNPATGMKYGEWNNEYDGLPNGMADYDGWGGNKEPCSVTAEPLDTNSYDQLFQMESTPLSRAYFSHKNIEFIRHSISGIFKKKYNIPLGLQPYKPTKLFMMQVYNDLSCDMCQTGDITKNFNIMNAYCLEELEKRIYKNLNFQFGYQNWVQKATNTVQIQNPMYTRVNKRELSLSKYYNGCEYQR